MFEEGNLIEVIEPEIVVPRQPSLQRDREAIFADPSIVKRILKETLESTEAATMGVFRSGGRRDKKPDAKLVLSVLLRQPQDLEKTGTRNLQTGKKELVTEISPGVKPPAYLQARVIRGDHIDEDIRGTMLAAFKLTKDKGFFDFSVEAGIRQMLEDFLERFPRVC